MNESSDTLNPRDRDMWQRYISHLRDIRDTFIPKYTYSEVTTRKLDLHGFPVNEAWLRFKEFIDQHHKNGDKSVVVITGKSGQIAREFESWCRATKTIREWEPLGRKNGPAGSFRVHLKQRNNL